ncbi:replication protein A 70 kDa DNA-binding subunit B-like [Abeliophyllum distichum]|uniref:Replication protein A 70 kDa DNA-binding subunit B-like n=1 Tax=Abeliophyllum distichum TaxID=126358 RepID=A0ABD1PRR5_9LAMI
MGDKLQLIHDVSPGTAGWTVKVVVTEKFSPRIAQRSPTKYQNLILMDSEGSTVQTTFFTDFEDLPKYMDSNVDISVIGIIIDIKPRRIIQTRFGKECQVQDLMLINKRFDTVLLTMWEPFVDNECKYICQNLKKKPCSDWKASQSNIIQCSFFIDGEFELVEEFKSWTHTNSEIIDNMISEKHYLTSTPSKLFSKLSVPTDEKDFTEIKSIQGLKTVIPTAASMRLSMDEDEIFYVKAITQESSPDCKFEILFIVNPSQIAGDKNKGKAPVEHIGEPIKLLEPTTKRSLFHSDTDDAQSSKKKCDKSRIESTKKNQ